MIQLDCFDHRIALRVERDGANGLPVACVSSPARRVPLTGAFVDLVSGRQDRLVMSFMSCRRAHVADIQNVSGVGRPSALASEIPSKLVPTLGMASKPSDPKEGLQNPGGDRQM